MSKTKEFYFNEINHINEDDILDDQYREWLEQQKIEDETISDFYEKFYEENKEEIEGERIFRLTNKYPF